MTETLLARTRAIYRLLDGGPHDVAFDGDAVIVGRENPIRLPLSTIDRIVERRSWAWSHVALTDTKGVQHHARGIRHRDAERLVSVVQEALRTRLEERRLRLERYAQDATSRLARVRSRVDRGFRQQLSRLEEDLASARYEVDIYLGGRMYAGHRDGLALRRRLSELTQWANRPTVRRLLTPAATEHLLRLSDLVANGQFEDARRAANARFVANEYPEVQTAVGRHVERPPSDEQAIAIATGEDCTLVLAGAGTGKTETIIARVVYLLTRLHVPPSEILVLAFNRSAAEEIRKRLPAIASGVTVSTFHAQGHRILAEARGSAPSIARVAQDDAAMSHLIESMVQALLLDPAWSDLVSEYFAYYLSAYRSPFEFENAGAYYAYVRRAELRALSGDLVRSFEELTIANFLTMHGIVFEYERPFRVTTASTQYRQYQPDFYLPDYDLYIEHFALNRGGHAPKHMGNYVEGVAWKREQHQQHHTRLIETYSWQHRNGTLLLSLRAQVADAGVSFRPIDPEQLIDRLRSTHASSRFTNLVVAFLNHAKNRGLSAADLDQRAGSTADPVRTRAFLRLFAEIRRRYEAHLQEQGAVDFHDLIGQATQVLDAGPDQPRFREILVDEFQDIAASRLELLRALAKDKARFFLVGDDWQSIYRFAGSDVSLLDTVQDVLGFTERVALQRTWRFGARILEPSTHFVRRNPAQSQRELVPNTDTLDEGITIVGAARAEEGVALALRAIAEADASGASTSVLLLGRYRHSAQAKRLLGPEARALRLDSSTVHRAKGRQADYVVVLDLVDDRMGFPSQVDDDELLQLVVTGGDAYPFAEERRLFYVAMTRARRGTFLITDRRRPSAFVRELVDHETDLRELGEPLRDPIPCPACQAGQLVPSGSAKTMRCTNFPQCVYQAPRCSCEQGYVVVRQRQAGCTSHGCRQPHEACPRCDRGLLVGRTGRNGSFWGCSEYSAIPPCGFTRDRPSAESLAD